MALMERRRLQVPMDEILDAMSSGGDEYVFFFLDLQTGRVESSLNPDFYGELDENETDFDRLYEEEPERFEEIPKYESREEYDLMCRFTDSVDEEDIRQRLDVALQGKGAFRRFRDVVFPYPDLKEKWFSMRQQALLEEALAWFESLGIEPIYELRSSEPVEAAPKRSSAPGIGLLDLILLGAPDGKTELLDGKVLRQFNARNGSEARAVFKHVARELCEYHGVAWRKRFIQNTSRDDIERAHLEVEGTVVRLFIDVPQAVWKAFE
jgi:hypothetical protein